MMLHRVRGPSPTEAKDREDTEGSLLNICLPFRLCLLVAKILIIKHVIRMNFVTYV